MMNSDLQTVVNSYEKVSLESIPTSLMNRVDTKYVFSARRLPSLMRWLTDSYRMLEVAGHRAISYESTYFDTPDYELFRQHHAGKGNRLKIRFRSYAENNLTFFEIKQRTNAGRVIKSRILVQKPAGSIAGSAKDFLEAKTTLFAMDLVAALAVRYDRTTLVHRDTGERVTIDRNIVFSNASGSITIPGLAIAEVKQEKRIESDFRTLMRTHDIRSGSMSKYCFGTATLVPLVRKNNFKPLIAKFNKPYTDGKPD